MNASLSSHLESVDPHEWPGVARVPQGLLAKQRARLAEAYFARACHKAGIDLFGTAAKEPDVRVQHEAVFYRIAASGWLGFTEGYMAGEWSAHNLSEVLEKLIKVGFNPPTLPTARVRPTTDSADTTGELPPGLVALSSGDGISAGLGLFSSGIPTTVQESFKSYVPNNSKKSRSSQYFVDVTRWTGPQAVVERADLKDAQERACTVLLDLAQVNSSAHILEIPCAGAAIGQAAALRGAAVDVITTDAAHAAEIEENFILSGVSQFVDINLLESPNAAQNSPIPARIRGRYDAVINVERLELLTAQDRKRYFALVDHVLSPTGVAAIQGVISTAEITRPANNALDALRAYIWPALDYPNLEELRKEIDRNTRLRLNSVAYLGQHYAASLELSDQIFRSQRSEAAAAGFDAIFRRLWIFQNALRRALLKLQMIDCVQYSLRPRIKQPYPGR
ncbi:class I SAM-dependent methyltransferase [Corynebacterium caspium]|uniref:class I SAM-dependent methyltransferase n=1 Tax=Corynebacterium caspium TaxID=234828 RepID=UPI000366549F|nr:class I SAM-dependent methyltransferase [Corynebacterium caspium]WKD59321.1 cyclopropane fatty acyl phospholipid synthase [Corynebacterium caspium DSM 44850]